MHRRSLLLLMLHVTWPVCRTCPNSQTFPGGLWWSRGVRRTWVSCCTWSRHHPANPRSHLCVFWHEIPHRHVHRSTHRRSVNSWPNHAPTHTAVHCTSHATQDGSCQRRSSQPISWPGAEETTNLTLHNKTNVHPQPNILHVQQKLNTKKLK